MSEGPLFPKKSDAPDAKNASPDPAPPIQIERSDDPSTSHTSSSTQSGVPNVQSRKVGCGSSVFALLLGIGLIGALAARVLI